jgi:hypothetical protein
MFARAHYEAGSNVTINLKQRKYVTTELVKINKL